MPNNHIVTKDYAFLRGFSTDADFVRPANVANTAFNMKRNPDTSFGPRRGYQCKAADIGGLGASAIEQENGQSPQIIVIHRDGNLYELLPSSLNISYTGSSFINISLFVDPRFSNGFLGWGLDPWGNSWRAPTGSSFTFRLYENNVLILDAILGDGFDSFIPSMSVQQLINSLNSISGVAAASSGDTSIPAAFLDLLEPYNLTFNLGYSIPFFYWRAVNRTVASTFPGSVANMNSQTFENATFASYGEVIYISNGYDFPQKFDGQTVYRAGMPAGIAPQVADSGISGNPNGSYQYFVTYEQIDAVGSIVEGVISIPASITVSNKKVLVTVSDILAGSGWNTDGAVVGASPITSTVTGFGPYFHTLAIASATLKAGDRAYYFDTNSSEFQTDPVFSVSSTSFTVKRNTATPVTLAALSAVSNTLMINIYRTMAGGTQPYLLASIPNNSFSATQVYTDDVSDANLQEPYSDPIRLPNPPPIAKYVIVFGNQLILSGTSGADDVVWFSEPENPEYVPTAFNFFIVPSNNDNVSALGVAGTTLIVGKDASIFAVMGDLASGSFTVRAVAPGSNIGVAAHATMKSIGNTLYFLDDNGVYLISESQLFPTDAFGTVVPLSKVINLFFRRIAFLSDRRFVTKRATAWDYTKDQQYWLFLPCETNPTVVDKNANANSRVLMYDYEEKNWFEWDSVNAAGNFVGIDDDIWWNERRFSANVGATANLYRQNRRYRLIDYVDHSSAIKVVWQSSWEDLGQPRVRKKFLRAVLLINREDDLYQFDDPLLQFSSAVDWLNSPYTMTTTYPHDNYNSWSKSLWSWQPWGGYRDTFVTIPLKNGGVAKAVSIGFTMQKINASFSLQGFQLEIIPDFNKTIVR